MSQIKYVLRIQNGRCRTDEPYVGPRVALLIPFVVCGSGKKERAHPNSMEESHSTDFEVHRNWLAITHNLSIDKWYYESTSEWTLDYPPLFGWFEFALSHIAKFFDPQMLNINNLYYASNNTVLFQRLSVILTDFVFLIGVQRCCRSLAKGRLLVLVLLMASPGLLMVDNIHFQYNGFLFGILMISISHIIRENHILAAFWFAVLLNLKHIFLYIAPVYFVYLLRSYCFTVSSRDGITTAWYSFSFKNFMKLALIVASVFAVSFGPFVKHLPQIASRLFPFKRGLSHAYWAPNFWALYNFADKALYAILLKLGYAANRMEGSMTAGLVQEYDHSVLPSVSPTFTFLLTVGSMLPALVRLWRLGADRKYRVGVFVRCLILCSMCSFMFGWHVHEKAILITLIPLSFMAPLGIIDGRMFLLLTVTAHYSLFPLLYPKNLIFIKVFLLLVHASIAFSQVPKVYRVAKKGEKKNKWVDLPLLNDVEVTYMLGFLLLCLYENVLHPLLGLSHVLPFLPLMMTSVYCAIGVLYFFIDYYYFFMMTDISHAKNDQPKFYDKVN